MPGQLTERELVSIQELLISQMIQIDTIAQLLIEKGIIGEQEFYAS